MFYIRSVPLADFTKHVDYMHRDTDYYFSAEYQVRSGAHLLKSDAESYQAAT